MSNRDKNIVYVVGAGLSAGLRFPTIANLLPKMWDRIAYADLDEKLSKVIRFHHPNFNPQLEKTFPNIELLLSEIDANTDLFDSSRRATGNFTRQELKDLKEAFLLELAAWFHEIQAKALTETPKWLSSLKRAIKKENAQIISFNWDLVLDQILFGDAIQKSHYGFGEYESGPRLLKPHGSLNWYAEPTGQYIKDTKRIVLIDAEHEKVFAFKKYRAPKSNVGRRYMPLIVPPTYFKQFRGALFQQLWQTTVSVLSTASEIRFLGYSLPDSDLPVRFILRCGFYNQENGELLDGGRRAQPTGRSKVTIIDPSPKGPGKIKELVGWPCTWHKKKIAEWIEDGGLA